MDNRQINNQHHWYAIHTYSAYEEKVAEELRQRISNLGIEDKITEVLVPKEKQIELKNGKRRIVAKRIFQSYVLVKMKLDKETWYTVRNTPNVTGFVGDGSNPTPIEDVEIEKILKRMEVEQPKHRIGLRHRRRCQNNRRPLPRRRGPGFGNRRPEGQVESPDQRLRPRSPLGA